MFKYAFEILISSHTHIFFFSLISLMWIPNFELNWFAKVFFFYATWADYCFSIEQNKMVIDTNKTAIMILVDYLKMLFKIVVLFIEMRSTSWDHCFLQLMWSASFQFQQLNFDIRQIACAFFRFGWTDWP